MLNSKPRAIRSMDDDEWLGSGMCACIWMSTKFEYDEL